MSVELKPGYYRTTGDGTVELFAERDKAWFGRIITPRGVSISNCWTPQSLEDSLVEYLGPTLPPDLGEGWTRTMELRQRAEWIGDHMVLRVVQKWVSGDEIEWRDVEVQQ